MNSTTNNYYPYGWIKFHMDYSFGANAGSLFEDWDSTKGTYYTLYRLLDSRIARWYQVEPLWEEYTWMSGYVVNNGNPVMYVDILGDKIKGFSIDSAGNVKYNSEEASEDVIRIWNIVKGTEIGEEYFKKLIEVPTEVKIKIRKGRLTKGYSYARLRGGRIGIYHKRATIVLSENVKEGIWGELSLTAEHRLGSTFVHEAFHLVDEENLKNQIEAEKLGVSYKRVREIEEPPLNAMVKMLKEMLSIHKEQFILEPDKIVDFFRQRVKEWLDENTKPLAVLINDKEDDK